jgi:hypothetical protein
MLIYSIAMIILIMFVIWIINHKQYKANKPIGDIGESIVKNRLSVLVDDYVVEHNVHLGKAQIDHLVINHGVKIVFVIETKLWGGIITGSSSDDYWRQDKNGVIRYFDNPIKQNNYHCSVVRKYYSGYKVYNVVVFVKNNNVPKSKCIIGVNDLVNYIIGMTNKVSNRGGIEVETDWLTKRV